MTFVLRVADISLVVKGDSPDFGSILDGDARQAAFTAFVTGTSKDDLAAQISTLNSRLATPCDLVLQSTDSTRPQALRLLGGGVASVESIQSYDLSITARVAVTAPCAPYATPANRVFLASPYGDEFPNDATVFLPGLPFDPDLIYADAGRYAVAGNLDYAGNLRLVGEATADELLVVEFDYDLVLASATSGLVVDIVFINAAGAVVDTYRMLSTTTVGRGHVSDIVLAPALATGFYLAAYALDTSGQMRGYVWNVSVGEKVCACSRQPLKLPYSIASGDLPHGWIGNTVAGVTYASHLTGASPHMHLYAAAAASSASVYGLADLDTYAGALPVKPGRVYGYSIFSQVTRYVSGTFVAYVGWIAADDSPLYPLTTVRSATAADGAAVFVHGVVTAPAGAAKAYLRFGTAGAADLDVQVFGNPQLGPHIVEAPGVVYLDAMEGEHPAPLDIWGDVDVDSNNIGGSTYDAHSVYYAVGRSDGSPITFEAESLTWTGGTCGGTTSADDYPGSGNTGKKNTGVAVASALIDAQKVRPGAYQLLVRARSSSASYIGTLGCTESGGAATTALTTPSWLSLGQITLPTKRTITGTANTFTVTMVSNNASGFVQVDRYLLVPLTQGGAVSYHDPVTPTTKISTFDIVGGVPYVDSVADSQYVVGGSELLAAYDDRLVVCAEMVASAEMTHAVDLLPLHRPRYSLWR